MAPRITHLTLLFIALFAMVAAITAIDSAFKNAPDNQASLEEQTIDNQIREEIVKIEKLHSIRGLKSLHMSPHQTKVRWTENGECLAIDAHAQNHEMLRIKSAPIDYKLQNMQVCFARDKLSRIESAFMTISPQKREVVENNFVHSDPTKIAANDIVVLSSFNSQKRPAVRVGDLENSSVNPLRTSFKRDYYLPHLRNTAYILQLTYDWHRREAVKTNEKTVNQYINSVTP